MHLSCFFSFHLWNYYCAIKSHTKCVCICIYHIYTYMYIYVHTCMLQGKSCMLLIIARQLLGVKKRYQTTTCKVTEGKAEYLAQRIVTYSPTCSLSEWNTEERMHWKGITSLYDIIRNLNLEVCILKAKHLKLRTAPKAGGRTQVPHYFDILFS